MRKLVIISLAVILTACSSPPKPPTVDGRDRHPVNDTRSQAAIAHQAKMAHTQEQQRVMRLHAEKIAAATPPRVQVITVLFPYNSTDFTPSWQDQQVLKRILPSARLVQIRARTDGRIQTVADEQVALGRAVAAQKWLMANGVPEVKISVNYVSAHDYVGDNTTNYGRTHNRRVEIEVTQ